MTKINYQALRELAKQATQGEWVALFAGQIRHVRRTHTR